MERSEIIVDCTELEAPEPLSLVISKLQLLDDTNRLKMIHRLKPQMLFSILDKNGYKYEIIEEEAVIIIFVWKE